MKYSGCFLIDPPKMSRMSYLYMVSTESQVLPGFTHQDDIVLQQELLDLVFKVTGWTGIINVWKIVYSYHFSDNEKKTDDKTAVAESSII